MTPPVGKQSRRHLFPLFPAWVDLGRPVWYSRRVGQEAPEFDWDDANRDHLVRHQVTPQEAEQAILDPHAILLEIESNAGEERAKAVGMTARGRVLAVVFTLRGEVIRPITAYAPSARLQVLYFQQRGT